MTTRFLRGIIWREEWDSKKAEGAIAARRDFLKRSAASVAAAGAVAVAGKSASAGETIEPKGAGYRETEHVKAFYNSARF